MRNIIIRILYKIRIIKFLNIYGTKKINNKKYKVPIIGKTGIHNINNWEPWLNTILTNIIAIDEGLFVDVGVNIGQTLLRVKSISPEIDYIGFEPNPICNHYVHLLITKNKIKKAIVLPVGLSKNNHVTKLALYNDDLSDSAASVIDNFRPGNKIHDYKYVPVLNIKTIKTNFDFRNLAIIKIDVEGAEYQVLHEFSDEIKEYQPIILIEILPVYSAELKDRLDRQQKLEALILALDYIIYNIKLDNGEVDDIDRIREIGIHSDIDRCEYVLVPKLKVKQFQNAFSEFNIG